MMLKNLFLLTLIGSSLAATTAFSDVNYGIQPQASTVNLNQLPTTSSSTTNTSASTNSNSNQNSSQHQQALINALLAKTKTNASVQNVSSPSAQSSSANPSDTGVGDDAFANTVRNMMPLTPDQIRTLRYLFDQSQRAAATYPGIPPRPTSTSVLVNLSPGATPPVIRLSSGFVTSLVFVDSTGAPWPIQAYDLGDPQSFNIQWDKKGNTLMVQALRHYTSGNLAVLLKGLDTPVTVTLLPGQDAVDYRVDLRVPGLGPDANPVLNGLPEAASPHLLDILNGIPPQGSQQVTVNGGDCEAWVLNGNLYLRTRLTVLSPAWISTMSSADGTHAYELQETPVVLASQRGQLVKLIIEGL